MEKPRLVAGAFFLSISIVADWWKLPRNGDVFCFVVVVGFWGLTGDFAGIFVIFWSKWL
jgi:hypothetical protein